MAEEQDSQERTEQASARRLADARKHGQVPRSRELNTMMVLLAGSAGLYATSGQMTRSVEDLFRLTLSWPREVAFADGQMLLLLAGAVRDALLGLAPFFGVMLLICIFAPLAVGGWNFSVEALEFKFDRMDPSKGISRVFGRRGVIETVKALAKFLLIGGVALLVLRSEFSAVMNLGHGDAEANIVAAVHLVGRAFVIVASTTILIALFDVPFQLWEHGRQLRMSRQQVREEMKETDGQPEVRARIRRMQQEIATRRMMAEVPRADVIVTNPTHFAVALRYDSDRMRAPRVVAKGADLIAARIRDVAAQHRVPTLSAPPLARALFHSTKLNHEIPAGLYVAVAQVLAYVVQLRAGAAVKPPGDLPIPDQYAR